MFARLTNRFRSISNQRWPDMKTDGMFGSILVGASAGGAGIIDGWERGEPFAMLKYGVGYTALGAPLGFLTFAFPFVSTAVMFAGGVGYAIHKNNAEHNNQDLVRR